MGRFNRFRRTQRGLKIKDLYPIQHNNRCDCGCGRKLRGRQRRWATKACVARATIRLNIIKGNWRTVRKELFKRDKGQCKKCRKRFKWNEWEADHIVAVCNGGGGCDLNGYQTLCKKCHEEKTKQDLITKRARKRSKTKGK